ncbi:acetyl-CoA synthetase-like protein, partial [Aspergillus ellipticus CBS 707.79]
MSGTSDCKAIPDDDSQSSATSASTPNSLSPSLRAVKCEGVPLQPFQAVERASYAQERIWFLHEYLADPTTFNVTLSYAVNGLLRPAEMADAFRTVANRHESLRTAFFLDSQQSPQLHQGILAESQIEISIQSIDTADVVDESYMSIKDHIYDLQKGQTMKVAILSLTPSIHFLILGFHHLVFDGFSAQIFIKDLQSVYSSGEPLPPAPNYRDYAVVQRQSIQHDAFRESLDFWKTKLANLPPPIPLFAFARVPSRKPLDSYQIHTVQRKLGIPLTSKIKEVANKVGGTTSFFLYLTALRELVFRLSGQQDICIGISDAGRSDKESLQVIGMFVNMIPLLFRTARPGQSFRNLLSTTTKQVRTALGHSAIPYQTLLDELSVKKSPYESPLFQILLNYKMGSTESAMLGECKAENLWMDDARTGLDLVFEVEEFVDGDCLLAVKGQEYLYSKESLEFIMSSLVVVLESVTSNPNIPVTNIGVFEEKSISHALSVSRGERVYPEETTVAHLFEQHCLAQPDSIAVKADGQFLTYRQLRDRAQQLANDLHRLGDMSGKPVVVVCKPSLDSIVAILGIHYAGCIYVPVDTEHPEERLRTITQDCDARAIVHHDATTDLANSVAGDRTLVNTSQLALSEAFSIQSTPKATAYILYTSGSTGKPKGVVVSHGNLTCQILSMRRDVGLANETVLHQSCVAFDASIDCIYAALAGQGTLVMVPPEVRRDPEQLASLMASEGITYTQMTSSEYHNLLIYGNEDLKRCVTWRNAFCGGEKFLSSLCPLFKGLDIPSLRVWNRYGPTEVTVSSSMRVIIGEGAAEATEVIPCGRPLSNYSVHILDDQRRPVPVGVPGEICTGGGGVAQGYLNNPRLTASKFVKNAHATDDDVRHGWDRLYRTGDRGYLLADGSMVFLGRMEGSTQVKIRGNRVELDEIETTILAASDGKILSAGVCVKGDNADAILAAYLVLRPDISSDALPPFISSLSKSLPVPRYMRPSSFIAVRRLPQTTSGKLDRQALSTLSGTAIPIEAHNTAPLTEQEQAMAHAWTQVLPDSVPLSADANFFEVGGNSLLLVRLQKLLEARTGTSIPLTALFSAPLLSTMSLLLS